MQPAVRAGAALTLARGAGRLTTDWQGRGSSDACGGRGRPRSSTRSSTPRSSWRRRRPAARAAAPRRRPRRRTRSGRPRRRAAHSGCCRRNWTPTLAPPPSHAVRGVARRTRADPAPPRPSAPRATSAALRPRAARRTTLKPAQHGSGTLQRMVVAKRRSGRPAQWRSALRAGRTAAARPAGCREPMRAPRLTQGRRALRAGRRTLALTLPRRGGQHRRG